MDTQALKSMILQYSYGGVMYDVSEGSELLRLVTDYNDTARELALEISQDSNANGIDKGVQSFIEPYI